MSSHAHRCLDVPGVNLIGQGVVTLEVIQSEKFIEFYGEEVSSYHVLHAPSSDSLKSVVGQSNCRIL